MSDVTKEKLHSGFIQIPYEFFQESEGRFSGRVETLLRGVIYGFSLGTHDCRFSYTAFEEHINKSRATVARAVGELRTSSDVEVTRKGGQTSQYKYVGEVERKKKHVRVPLFLFYELFEMPKGKDGTVEKRSLTCIEILVYSLILTHSMKDGNTGRLEASEIGIAKILNCSQRSVDRAILALMKADMISRPKKGINRQDAKSLYRADLGLYRRLWLKHNPREAKKEKEKSARRQQIKLTNVDANARTDRERYYSRLRELAQNVLDRNLEKANAVLGFADVARKLSVLQIDLAKAELKAPDKLSGLREQERALTFERDRLLRSVGLTPAELTLRHQCAMCSDTGYRKDGKMCTCYTPPPKGAP